MSAIVSAVVLATGAVGVLSSRTRISVGAGSSAGSPTGECELAMAKQLQEASVFFKTPRRNLCNDEAVRESEWDELLSKSMMEWRLPTCADALAHFQALQRDGAGKEEGRGAWASFRLSVRGEFCRGLPELERQVCSCSRGRRSTVTDHCDGDRDAAPLCARCDGKCVVFVVPRGQSASAKSCGMASAGAGLRALRDGGGDRLHVCEMDPMGEAVLEFAFKPVMQTRRGNLYQTPVESLFFTNGGGVSKSAAPGFVTDAGESDVEILFDDGVTQLVPSMFVTTSMVSLCAPMDEILGEIRPCLQADWAGQKCRGPKAVVAEFSVGFRDVFCPTTTTTTLPRASASGCATKLAEGYLEVDKSGWNKDPPEVCKFLKDAEIGFSKKLEFVFGDKMSLRMMKSSAECREIGPDSSSYEALADCVRGDWEGKGCASVKARALGFVGDFANQWCAVNDGWGSEVCKCSWPQGDLTAACNYKGDFCKTCLREKLEATCVVLPKNSARLREGVLGRSAWLVAMVLLFVV
mmetsp:Transcript_7355/g.23338  ORF Transcript_7355/g.23338 Transcript_7355/m.23338 type:complete len:522 (-) Transcript_7355:84-1649(-)